jgi:flagellar motor switch protein FliM
MRVLSQSEIDAMLAELLANPSVLPGSEAEQKKEEASESDAS